MVWNCELVKQRSTMGSTREKPADSEDAIIQILSDHEHVIDCIVWAHAEAAKTIESASYNGGLIAAAVNAGDESTVNEDGETAEGGFSEASEVNQSAAASTSAAASELDESRANMQTRVTTKERI